MSLIDFIFALLFLAIALSLVTILGWMLIEPVLVLLRSRSGATRPRKKKTDQALNKIDSLLERGETLEALKIFRKSFSFDTPSSLTAVREIRDFNQGLIARVLVAFDEQESCADIVSEIQESLIERNELLVLFAKAHESFQNIRFRREQAGKELPSWSKSDFDARIKEIKAELTNNHKQLSASLDLLLTSFEKIPPADKEDDPITYH